jgi:GAF domain-containing protein
MECVFEETPETPGDVTGRSWASEDYAVEQERALIARLDAGAGLGDVLARLARSIEAKAQDGMITSVLLLDADGQHLRHGAAPSLPDAYNAAIDGIAIGPSVGSCGTAAYCGHPIYVADIAADPLWQDFRDLALAHGLRACWSTPIVAEDDRILGTFALYYRQPRSPTERDRELIRRAVRTAALLIGRARERKNHLLTEA